MLATSTFPTSAPTFLPLIPSPLSPRRARTNSHSNAHNQSQPHHQQQHSSPIQQQSAFTFSMTPPTTPSSFSSPPSNGNQNQPFSTRQIKTPPAAKTASQNHLLNRRRALFLSKVQQNREARRWDDRIEDLAQLDWRREKRVWEGVLAEEARSLSLSSPEESDLEEVEIEETGQQGGDAETEAEEVLRREKEELDALVEMMEGQSLPRDHETEEEMRGGSEGGFGSEDDEEYDSLFMDLIEGGEGLVQEGRQHGQHIPGALAQVQMHAADQDEEMDLS